MASINPAPYDNHVRSDDMSAGDDGAVWTNATGAMNAAGTNNGVRLFDRGHNASHHNEGGDGAYDCLFHLNTPLYDFELVRIRFTS